VSLVRLGQVRPASDEPEALLRDCHERIRRFAALAVRLAADEADATQLCQVAAAVHRYFTVALPLHVEDEERSIAPRLAASPALATVRDEHRAHETLLARLIPAWEALTRDPRARAATLDEARALEATLEAHLALEEREILPAVAALPERDQRDIVAEMRARRA
jgi:hypothetical protein